ncbi:hypothetical protein ACFY93_24355 [Streptomyces sp. NPDC008313]|uniref:hypothetical protein n=1 Tax=Streptomyces sp. NPDC008313 TaxID=3364826 RepID=UPI0036E6B27E
MPFTPPPRDPSGPRRRSLLFASAAGTLVLAGCSGSGSSDGTAAKGPSAADRARTRAARDSETLAAHYAAVIGVHPKLAERLGPLRAEVLRHAEAFGAGKDAPASASPATPSARKASGSASPSPAATATVPADERDALAGLASAERSLADGRAKALLDVPGELARLLASVAAAGAAHAYLLTEGDK